jgi:hypothetical protein
MMDISDGEIQILDEYRRSDAVTRFESLEFLAIPDREFHGHGPHPAFDGLMLDSGDVSLWVEADNLAVNCVVPFGLFVTGAGTQK